MFRHSVLCCALAVVAAVADPALAGSQTPTAAEARELLKTRPDLVERLRREIANSGLTPEQVRARLRASGYPEGLLDEYLSPTGSGTSPHEPSSDVMRAVAALGLVSDTLSRSILSADSLQRADTLRDTLAMNDSVTRVFGMSLFARPSTQFDANTAGPVDASYRLGPGDQLVLILTGDVEAAYTLDVTREGFVVIPQVGQVNVANLTLDQLNELLYSRLARVYSGIRRSVGTARFTVSVSKLRTNQIFVVGEVRRPGSYRVSSAGTVLTALYAAGGPGVNGSLRQIQVRRGGSVVTTLDVYEYLTTGSTSNDVRLQNGDVVFVPLHGMRVELDGEVVRPGIYELRPGETLPALLQLAGGFLPSASLRRMQVERILPPNERLESGRERVVFDVSAEELTAESGPGLPLHAGDVIRVFPISGRVSNRIKVAGAVWQPGVQGFHPGMKLSDAIEKAGGVRPGIYLDEILVNRLQPDSSRMVLRSAFRDTTGALVHDLVLKEDDEIRIFARSDYRNQQYVSVTGAVGLPGRFPYHQGMSLRDVLLLAGGFEEGADLREVEVARLPEDRSDGRTAITMRVPLDATYRFDAPRGVSLAGSPREAQPAAPDFVLKPFDNVLVFRKENWSLQRTVWLTGEVRFPGKYALTNKGERLRELVARAGGLSPMAYPGGIMFYRGRPAARVGVALDRVLANPGDGDNLVLLDGDSIHVPIFNGIVRIEGAVNSTSLVSYVPGRDVDDYLRAAGGPTPRADLDRVYVVQANGKIQTVKRRALWPDAIPKPQPGSTVIVPTKTETSRINWGAALTASVQILASIAAIIAVTRR